MSIFLGEKPELVFQSSEQFSSLASSWEAHAVHVGALSNRLPISKNITQVPFYDFPMLVFISEVKKGFPFQETCKAAGALRTSEKVGLFSEKEQDLLALSELR